MGISPNHGTGALYPDYGLPQTILVPDQIGLWQGSVFDQAPTFHEHGDPKFQQTKFSPSQMPQLIMQWMGMPDAGNPVPGPSSHRQAGRNAGLFLSPILGFILTWTAEEGCQLEAAGVLGGKWLCNFPFVSLVSGFMFPAVYRPRNP